MQVGGTGGFIVCVEDTQSDATRVVLRRLAPGGWDALEVALTPLVLALAYP